MITAGVLGLAKPFVNIYPADPETVASAWLSTRLLSRLSMRSEWREP